MQKSKDDVGVCNGVNDGVCDVVCVVMCDNVDGNEGSGKVK